MRLSRHDRDRIDWTVVRMRMPLWLNVLSRLGIYRCSGHYGVKRPRMWIFYYENVFVPESVYTMSVYTYPYKE